MRPLSTLRASDGLRGVLPTVGPTGRPELAEGNAESRINSFRITRRIPKAFLIMMDDGSNSLDASRQESKEYR